ncbi:MAG: CapA family protein [Alphaproteobacteria bacterium]|nr:CapA family protein [Alphaproteobacteria bacterium]
MQHKMILTGDINLMGVTDPTIPFAQIGDVTRGADVVFANLECCFYEPMAERSVEEEGFYASLKSAEALTLAGVHAVGNANNVNIGGSAIRSSVGRLDELGIAHTGAGVNREEAARPVIIERDGVRYGFMQRSSVYWNHGHEATDDFPGISIVRAHTAYRPQIDQLKTLTRPGMPPEVVTWADAESLAAFQDDIASLRQRADVVIASNHWGLDQEILTYQQEIAHAAIEAGADLVLGHGPHFPLGIEVYKDKPVFYGVGSFSFETGHRAQKHPDWLGLMLHVSLDDGALQDVAFSFVRHNARNETVPRDFEAEHADLEDIREKSARFGTTFAIEDGRAIVWRKT